MVAQLLAFRANTASRRPASPGEKVNTCSGSVLDRERIRYCKGSSDLAENLVRCL